MDPVKKASKHSWKRDEILRVLQETNEHPTADWIYQKLRLTIPDLSLGTVYRNLARFKEEGTVISVGTVNGQERFDAYTVPHTHFVCQCCGKVIDLESVAPSIESQAVASGLPGAKIETWSLTLTGLCPDCAENIN